MSQLHQVTGVTISERSAGDGSAFHTLSSDVEPLQLARQYVDHFTLTSPSNTVRFRSRNNAAKVFENKHTQFILEENYDPVKDKRTITVKRLKDSSKSLQALRATYTAMGLLWTGILFAFFLQVLLFLVLDMAVQSGQTSVDTSFNIFILIGVMLAIIMFIDGFSSTMVLASLYFSELWSGHYLVKQFVFINNSDVIAEWVFFAFFLGFPSLVLGGTLLARLDDWWTISSLFWFSCVTLFFFLFAANVVFYEVKAAIAFVRNRGNAESSNWFDVVKQCILLRQAHAYSGREMDTYMARSFFNSSEDSEVVRQESIIESTRDQSQFNWWASFTKAGFVSTNVPGGLKLFRPLDPPIRLHTIDDVQDYRPFITSSTWSLERIFCRPTNSRYIAIVDGPGSVTSAQIRSSMVCSAVGTFLVFFLLISLLVWAGTSTEMLIIAMIVFSILAWKSLKSVRRLRKVSKHYLDLRAEAKLSRSQREQNGDDYDESYRPRDGEIQAPAAADVEGIQVETKQVVAVTTSTTEEENHYPEDEDPPSQTIDQLMIRKLKTSQSVTNVTFASSHTVIEPEHDPETALDENDEPINRYDTPTGESRRQWDLARSAPSEGLFLVSEYNRVTQVTDRFCWLIFSIEFVVYFLYPTAVLLYLSNWGIAVFYVGIAAISSLRHYINVAIAIEETGNMDLVDGATEAERWANKSRLSDIVGKVTQDKSRKIWTAAFWAFGLIALGLFFTSIGTSTESKSSLEYTYLNDFTYPTKVDDMRYPVCSLPNINRVFGENSTIADYVFLSGLAYNNPNNVRSELDGWYGDKLTVVDDQDAVVDFRKRNGYENSAASFKLFTMKESRLAIVAIRGTHTNWDLLADLQLWSAAMLAQSLRAILPLGEMWTPILDELVLAINQLESEAVADVSFYRVITPFVEELKKSGEFDHIQVTGHSLGGGLAMITGSQAKVPAVSISGPGALISGKSFSPPVTREMLNEYAFNIIPDNDLVAHIDDSADNFLQIRCTTNLQGAASCHDYSRTMCEIAYKCGNANRPVVCICHLRYGYPKPEPLPGTNRTFEEACASYSL